MVKPLLVNNNNNSHLFVYIVSLLDKVKTDNCTEIGALYTDMISCLKSQTGTVLSIKDVLYQERLLSNVKNVLCLMSHRRFSMNHAKDFRISNCQLLQAVLMLIVSHYDHTMIIFCSFSLSIEKNCRSSTSFNICFGIGSYITRIVLERQFSAIQGVFRSKTTTSGHSTTISGREKPP